MRRSRPSPPKLGPVRRRIQIGFALLGAVLTLAVTAVPAAAASNPVIADCNAHGALTKTYSISALHQALSSMSAITKEYTSCSDVINRALAAAVSGGGTGGGTGNGGSGSFLPTPVIIILVLLILAAVGFGALAIRRRRDGPAPSQEPGGTHP